jgi:hypothetical protein
MADNSLYFLNEIIDFARGAKHIEHQKEYQEVLQDAIKKAWVFYENGRERSARMAENLVDKVTKEKIDRGILITGGFHLPGIWHHLSRLGFSMVLIVPIPAVGDFQISHITPIIGGFSDELCMGQTKSKIEHSFSTADISKFEDLPIKHCESNFCISEGRLILAHVICIKDPGENIVLWCNICHKYRCGYCATKVPVPKDRFQELPYSSPLKKIAILEDKYPFSLGCKHCGELLGVGDETIILV